MVERLMDRWNRGPIGPPPRPRRRVRSTRPIFTVRPMNDGAVTGSLTAPERVLGQEVVAQVRVRRDRSASLVALEDGRYAIVGPSVVVGSRDDIAAYARRRAAEADPDDRAWLQAIIGAVAIDVFDLHETRAQTDDAAR